MNKYAKTFVKEAHSYSKIALARHIPNNQILEVLREPIKYAYLYQQRLLETAYFTGKIDDSIAYYAMQARLTKEYVRALNTPVETMITSRDRHVKTLDYVSFT